MLNSHMLASVRLQFRRLHFVRLGQLCARENMMSSVISFTPANRSTSRSGQFVVIICTNEGEICSSRRIIRDYYSNMKLNAVIRVLLNV